MIRKKDYPQWQNQPCWLKIHGLEQPEEVLRSFFETYSLPVCRKNLWDMLTGFMNSELADDMDRTERSDLLFFYQGMIEVLEAGSLIAPGSIAD